MVAQVFLQLGELCLGFVVNGERLADGKTAKNGCGLRCSGLGGCSALALWQAWVAARWQAHTLERRQELWCAVEAGLAVNDHRVMASDCPPHCTVSQHEPRRHTNTFHDVASTTISNFCSQVPQFQVLSCSRPVTPSTCPPVT